jgi:hypothetical protein
MEIGVELFAVEKERTVPEPHTIARSQSVDDETQAKQDTEKESQILAKHTSTDPIPNAKLTNFAEVVREWSVFEDYSALKCRWTIHGKTLVGWSVTYPGFPKVRNDVLACKITLLSCLRWYRR